jgi:hypothetical protein
LAFGSWLCLLAAFIEIDPEIACVLAAVFKFKKNQQMNKFNLDWSKEPETGH